MANRGRRAAAAGLVLALVVVLALFLPGREEGGPTADTPPRSDVPAPARAPEPPSAAILLPGLTPLSPAVSEGSATAVAKLPVVLEIRVLRSDGAPAAGAEVRVYESDPSQEGYLGAPADLPPRRGRGIADGEGKVRIEVPEALWGGFVSGFLGDEAATTDRAVHLKDGARHAVELRLEPSFRIRGTVVDARNRLVPHASVLLLAADVSGTMSSSVGPYDFAVPPERMEDGSFEFAPLGNVDRGWEGWEPLRLRVRAEGYLPAEVPVEIEAAARRPVEVRIFRAGVVRGRVVDGRGKPVAGAAVAWREAADSNLAPQPGSPPSSATGGDGRFELSGVPEPGGEIRVSAQGFAPAMFPVAAFDAERGADAGDLALADGETVGGYVVDVDGAPVAGVAVRIGDGAALTDAAGRFTVRDAPPPAWALFAEERPPGDLEGRKGSLLLPDRKPPEEVRIRLTEERLVRVEIEFAPGKEPETLRRFWTYVNLRRKGETVYEKCNIHWGRTRFRLWAESTGDYEVVLEAGDYGNVTLPVTVGADREVVVRAVLPPKGKE
jgi:hypothetical protein